MPHRLRPTRPSSRTGVPMLVALALALGAPPLHASDDTSTDDPARGAIRVYQQYLSSMRHLHCRFSPSCSQYAIEAIARYGIVQGSARAADRLMRCNASSETRYRRDPDGLLIDPVDGSARSPVALRVPDWLLPAAHGQEPPAASRLAPDRRTRLAEAVEFAWRLEQRGDCERASAEFQRAGALADTVPADAWAYACIGDCYFRSSQWYFADRAYLTSAMLTSDPSTRANLGMAAAVSRFDAGAFVACARLLSDSALAVSAPAGLGVIAASGRREGAPVRGPGIPPGRLGTLAGLCGAARGEWAWGAGMLRRAARETADSVTRTRVLRLAAYAERGRDLPHRSPGVAGVLSALVPGAGQMYDGHVKDGIRHLLFNAALVYTVASLARHHEVPASVIVGGVELPFYVGNVLGAQDGARRFNSDQDQRFLQHAIEESSR